MLEHTDGYDAIECALHIAIIKQLESDAIIEPKLLGALASDLKLLLGQRDPQYLNVLQPRQ